MTAQISSYKGNKDMARRKRIIKALSLCIIIFLFNFVITGCAKNNKAEDKLSRAAYIGMLGDSFGINEYEAEENYFTDVKTSDNYYSQIQACAEWEVIVSSDKFNPTDQSTLEFALESAVRAVGIDKLQASGELIDTNNLVNYYINNIAEIDISKLDSQISKETAEQIIGYALDYRNNIELPQICEINLKEGVKSADLDISLNYDGKTGNIKDGSKYSVGDIVYWKESNTSMARGIKITNISDGMFRYEDAELEDIYSDINITGTFEANVIEATSASDGTNVNYNNILYNEISTYGVSYASEQSQQKAEFLANGVKVDKGKNHVTFKAQVSGKNSGSGKSEYYGDIVVAIKNINTTVNYKHESLRPFAVKEISANVSFDTEISSKINAEFSRTIPLGEVYLSVAGPINLRLVLSANIGANGEVSISYTTDNNLYAGWKKNKGLQKSFNSKPVLEYNADATVTAEATALCDLIVGWKNISKSIVNVEVTTGLVAIGKTDGDLLSSEPLCTDVLVYVPLRWGINQRACILTDIKSNLKYKQTVWDSTNSAFQLHLHFENNVRTAGDKCTRGEKKEVVQEKADKNGKPIDEIELFDFELVDFDFIKLETYVVFLNENSTAKMGITYLPEGYEEKDLTYEVENKSVCSVDAGNIKALGEGSTVVRVHTSDGMLMVSFAVIVSGNYSVEGFNPI